MTSSRRSRRKSRLRNVHRQRKRKLKKHDARSVRRKNIRRRKREKQREGVIEFVEDIQLQMPLRKTIRMCPVAKRCLCTFKTQGSCWTFSQHSKSQTCFSFRTPRKL